MKRFIYFFLKKTRLIISIFIATLLLVAYLYIQNNCIEVEDFTVKMSNLPKVLDGFKIAHLSDIHLPKNASSVPEILRLVQNQHPNIIVLTGDIIDTSADLENCGLLQLIKGISKIAPTYAVTGNHEYRNGNTGLWVKIMEENNVVVLQNKSTEFKMNGATLLIMGLDWQDDEQKLALENKPSMPKLLLIHRPEIWKTYIDSLNPDLILCGHAHGGQFRIPFLGGVISPGQGLFPKYTSGMYILDNFSKMIVSRGLGNSIIPIRINNRPQLPIITLRAN